MSELASVVLDKSPKDTATVSLFRSEIHENVCDTVKNSKQFNKKEFVSVRNGAISAQKFWGRDLQKTQLHLEIFRRYLL